MDLSQFEVYALNNYKTSTYIMSEFFSDLKRVKIIKKLISKYKTSKNLKDRLLINNLVIFFNVFKIDAANTILFSRIEKENYDILKTILTYLSYMQDIIVDFEGNIIINSNIPLNQELLETLKGL